MGVLRTALLQGPSGAPASVEESLEALEAAAREAAAQGARLLVTSELFTSGYAVGAERLAEAAEPADGPTGGRVAELAARYGIAVVHGYPEREGAQVFNSARLTGPDGAVLANYRKAHLYGDHERAAFAPGGEAVVQASVDGVRVGLLICYDVEFPEAVRAHALAGTELLAVPTALMKPHEFIPRNLVPTRAFENGIHIAYVNRCGPEGEYDFAGLSCLAGPGRAEPARAGTGPGLVIADADPQDRFAARAENPYLADRRPELYRSLD